MKKIIVKKLRGPRQKPGKCTTRNTNTIHSNVMFGDLPSGDPLKSVKISKFNWVTNIRLQVHLFNCNGFRFWNIN